jgi:hypothetical protein
VAPGPIETPLLNAAPEQLGELGVRLKQGMINATAMRRSGEPNEVASVIRVPGQRRRGLRHRAGRSASRAAVDVVSERTDEFGRRRPAAHRRRGHLAGAVLSTPGDDRMMEHNAARLALEHFRTGRSRWVRGLRQARRGRCRGGPLHRVRAPERDRRRGRKLRFDVEVREGRPHDRRQGTHERRVISR